MSIPRWMSHPEATVSFTCRPELLRAVRVGAKRTGGKVRAVAAWKNSVNKAVTVTFTGNGLQDRCAAFIDGLAPLRLERDWLGLPGLTLLPSNTPAATH